MAPSLYESLFDQVTAPHPAAALRLGVGVIFCAALSESDESPLPPHAASKPAAIPVPIPTAILVFNSLSSHGHERVRRHGARRRLFSTGSSRANVATGLEKSMPSNEEVCLKV